MNNFQDNAASRFWNVVEKTRRRMYMGQNRLTYKNIKKILIPWASYDSRFWSKIFLVLSVIGVSIDPFFLYIPVINEGQKCLEVDKKMMNVAVFLRTLTDFIYLLDIIFRLRSTVSIAKLFRAPIHKGFPGFYLVIDVLAILPLPQVIILKFFSKIAGSRTLATRKFFNFLLLLQYLPRILRVYLFAKDLGRTFDSLTRVIWVKGVFNVFLYIIGCHIFGALWYFHAMFRETACWHYACRHYPGCNPSDPFDCRANSINPIKNMTYLNEFCPVDPPNSTVFDFGIFTDAIESHILRKKDFRSKFSRSFWWGMQTISSFGQSLETSSNIMENIFAILISLFGLLIFLYLIGNVQIYMELSTTKAEKTRKKLSIKQPEIELYLSEHNIPEKKKKVIMRYLQDIIKDNKDFDVKYLLCLLSEHIDVGREYETFAEWITKLVDVEKYEKNTAKQKAELWMSKNEIPSDSRLKIIRYVQLRLRVGKDVDIGIENVLPILPSGLEMTVKKHICLPILQKVPMFQNMEEPVYDTICNFLKPMTFAQSSYIIRKEEPLDLMLFIIQGVVWTFGSSTSPKKRLQKGDYYGEELIEWQLSSGCDSEFPISTANLKSHTKVEAFALMAIDLEHVLSSCWSNFFKRYRDDEPIPEGLKHFAVVHMQQRIRRNIPNNNQSQPRALSIQMP